MHNWAFSAKNISLKFPSQQLGSVEKPKNAFRVTHSQQVSIK